MVKERNTSADLTRTWGHIMLRISDAMPMSWSCGSDDGPDEMAGYNQGQLCTVKQEGSTYMDVFDDILL